MLKMKPGMMISWMSGKRAIVTWLVLSTTINDRATVLYGDGKLTTTAHGPTSMLQLFLNTLPDQPGTYMSKKFRIVAP